MIRFDCPACGKSLKVADDLAGKVGKCPACGERMKVPTLTPVIAQSFVSSEPPKSPVSAHAQLVETPLIVPVQDVRGVRPFRGRQPSKASHSLGIASLILGVLAFLICWVPLLGLLGLPLSLLGILLGGIGTLIALFRKGSGIGFPIAGTALSLLSAITVVAITGAAATAVHQLGKAIDESSSKAVATHQMVVPKVTSEPPKAGLVLPDSAEAETEKATPEAEWVDAQNAVQQGDLQLKVSMVAIGHVPLEDSFSSDSKSQHELLMVNLELMNTSEIKKIDYRTWSGADVSFRRDYATVVDNFGNSYKRIDFGFSSHPVGAVQRSESIYPNKTITDVLVFEMPIDTIEFLRLELPAESFGGTGMLRLEIPKSMITR